MPNSDKSSDETTDLSTKQRNFKIRTDSMDSRLNPLRRAIAELERVERLIRGNELPASKVGAVIEDIRKKMLADMHQTQSNTTSPVPSRDLSATKALGRKGKREGRKLGSSRIRIGEKCKLVDADADMDYSFEGGVRGGVYDDGCPARGPGLAMRRKKEPHPLTSNTNIIEDITNKQTADRVPGEDASRFKALDRCYSFKEVDYWPVGAAGVDPQPGQVSTYGRSSEANSLHSLGEVATGDSILGGVDAIRTNSGFGSKIAASEGSTGPTGPTKEPHPPSKAVSGDTGDPISAADAIKDTSFGNGLEITVHLGGVKKGVAGDVAAVHELNEKMCMPSTKAKCTLQLLRAPDTGETGRGAKYIVVRIVRVGHSKTDAPRVLVDAPATIDVDLAPQASTREATDPVGTRMGDGIDAESSVAGDTAGPQKAVERAAAETQKQQDSRVEEDLAKPELTPKLVQPESSKGGGMAGALKPASPKKPEPRPESSESVASMGAMDLDAVDVGDLAAALGDEPSAPDAKMEVQLVDKPKEETKEGKKKKAPPPPPPRPKGGLFQNAGLVRRDPDVVDMFQEIRRGELGRQGRGKGGGKRFGRGVGKAADAGALVAEITKNSKYAQAVQDDVLKYEPLINCLIKEVANFTGGDMKSLLALVESTDAKLDELSDETAVLKEFEWPKKYFIFREAKASHVELEGMKQKLKNWPRNKMKTAGDELQEIETFMKKAIERVDAILRTKDSDEKKFKEVGIPWNKKSTTEVKHASLSLMELYMGIILEEVERVGKREAKVKAAKKKALEILTGAIKFAFHVHAFAGGFTEACSAKFGEIRAKTRELREESASKVQSK